MTSGNDFLESTETQHGRFTGLTKGALRYLSKDWLNALGVALVLFVFFLAIFGDTIAPYSPTEVNVKSRLQPASGVHWFGTDHVGRDVFSRVLSGAKYSVWMAALILSIAVTVGVCVGLFAGFAGGAADEILMRLTDLFLAFPALIFAIAIAATLGRGLTSTGIALTTVYWPWYARMTRGQALSLKSREYVLAARCTGASSFRILGRHIWPNVLPVLLIQVTLDVGYAILSTAGLSFLGLGAQPPQPEWGAMILDGRQYMRDFWWIATFPGAALFVTVLGFNLLGDGLRDWLDPRLRRAGK
jgi:peptide/nickel transport system permease protein